MPCEANRETSSFREWNHVTDALRNAPSRKNAEGTFALKMEPSVSPPYRSHRLLAPRRNWLKLSATSLRCVYLLYLRLALVTHGIEVRLNIGTLTSATTTSRADIRTHTIA